MWAEAEAKAKAKSAEDILKVMDDSNKK